MLFRSFYFITEGEGTGEEVVYKKDTVTVKTSFTKKGELVIILFIETVLMSKY